MRSLKVLSYLVLILIQCSCESDDLIPGPGSDNNPSIWEPCISLEKDDGQVTLFLSNPLPLLSYSGRPPSDPDSFRIWVSEFQDDEFNLFRTVHASTTSVVMNGLQNGRPYYVFVTSHKGSLTDSTGMVMTIPSPTDMEVFPAAIDPPFERFSMSAGSNYVSFVKNNRLFVRASNSTSTLFAEETGYSASWSATSDRMVYLTSIDQGNFRYPHAVKVFDTETGTANTLLEIDYHNYYIHSPSFTPDGEKLTFLSSEGNSQKSFYDLWTLDLLTGEKKKITDFGKTGFNIGRGYSWAPSEEVIYVSGNFDINAVESIYGLNVSSGLLSPVIESRWNDHSPVASPDNSRIVFISDRSGREELWLFDMDDARYRQLTGPDYTFDSRYTNRDWLGNDNLLLTVFAGQTSVPVTIKVN